MALACSSHLRAALGVDCDAADVVLMALKHADLAACHCAEQPQRAATRSEDEAAIVRQHSALEREIG